MAPSRNATFASSPIQEEADLETGDIEIGNSGNHTSKSKSRSLSDSFAEESDDSWTSGNAAGTTHTLPVVAMSTLMSVVWRRASYQSTMPLDKVPAPSKVTRTPTKHALDKDLWLAVRAGNVEKATAMLDAGADPDCFIRAEDLQEEEALVYKSRKVSCSPLHVAALYQQTAELSHEALDDAWLNGAWLDRSGRFYNGKAVWLTEQSWHPETSARDFFHHEGATYWRAGHRLFERRSDGIERCFEVEANSDGSIAISYPSSSLHWTLHRMPGEASVRSMSTPSQAINKSRQLCELLLDRKAHIAAEAAIISSTDVRMLQAIHMAAGAGNKRTLELLLERGANPNAGATLNGMLHYRPMHDAAWFNREDCARVLIEQGAMIEAKNGNEETGLHIAAMLGYPGLVKLFLDRHEDPETLLLMENKKGEIPLDVALRRGYFPLRELKLFTQNLGHDGRIRTFNAAAKCCPSAISWIFRSGDQTGVASSMNEHDCTMSLEWRQSLQQAAREDQITVKTLSRLMGHAPDAALCLLDALTEEPAVCDQQHNPLPVRALLPKSICGAAVTCEYEPATSWEWTQETYTGKTQEVYREFGMNAWQQTLAPPNSSRGVNVDVRVLLLNGVISLEAIYGLAKASDPRIFSKPVVQAILKLAWNRLMWMFLLDLLHQILCIVVLCFWASGASFSDPVSHLMSSCLASHGATQLLNCGFNFWKLRKMFNRREALSSLWASSFRVFFGIMSIALVFSRLLHFHHTEDYTTVILATNCLLHSWGLLMKMKAFENTGYKLLPIIKSVDSIAQMLVLMGVLLLGFVLAFWAVDTMPKDGSSNGVFNVFLFAFTGEVGDSFDMDKNVLTKTLGLGLVFIFLTCTMNVFIAVLGDSYDIQQERMLCTFMAERARLCSKLLMGASRPAAACVFILGIVSWAGVFFSDQMSNAIFTCLALALGPAGAIQFARASLRRYFKTNWSERHLWFCHESNVEESFVMNAGLGDLDDKHSGRLTRIKQSVFELRRCITEEKRNSQAQQSSMASLKRDMAMVARSVQVMSTTSPHPAFPAEQGVAEALGGMRHLQEDMHRRQEALQARQEGLEKTCRDMSAGITSILGMLQDAQQRKSLLRTIPANSLPPV